MYGRPPGVTFTYTRRQTPPFHAEVRTHSFTSIEERGKQSIIQQVSHGPAAYGEVRLSTSLCTNDVVDDTPAHDTVKLKLTSVCFSNV
jgi:hypothetical protein